PWTDHGFFFLTAAVTGQVVLEQSRDLTVKEDAGATFQCSMRGGSMGSYYMFWYRQGPRGALEFIFREGGSYGEGFQHRFKGSKDSSQNRFTL
ncbi:HV459 protein, partial [Ramphastos sulfuratus]|nr:HV459 protein [Ramphastos sulfuratus]